MVIARQVLKMWQSTGNRPGVSTFSSRGQFLLTMLLACAVVFSGGCGQTAKPVISPATGEVDSYFGGPFNVPGSNLYRSVTTFDHAASQVGVSAFVKTSTALVPTQVISGGFTPASTGFLSITENFAPSGTGLLSPQNPPLTGAWAVEIAGAGALANFLNVTTSASTVSVRAAPAAMAENAVCPNFPDLAGFLYVTVPDATKTTVDTADYGGVTLSSQGSAITFRTQPYLIGAPAPVGFNVTGGCSITNSGALTAYPLNSFGSSSNIELISIGSSGILVSSFNTAGSGNSPGAFGGGTGVIGVAQPAGDVNVSAVVKAKYNGFLYAPLNRVPENYDITVLASAYGDNTATSQACSALQASLVANNGQGAGTVPVLPSANSIYGGEFLTATSSGNVNDPTSGSENCDVVIDLGQQSSTASGVFPNATLFIGSNFPPFSISNPWTCGAVCAVSFPAAAIVGQVQGQYVIFVVASASSKPQAQLPDQFGSSPAQPIGIYLFQKTQ
jgi:hypothetical protein